MRQPRRRRMNRVGGDPGPVIHVDRAGTEEGAGNQGGLAVGA
jgi:hypothetical protein